MKDMIYPIAPFAAPGKEDFCYWEGFLSNEEINYLLSRPEWHDSDVALIGGHGNQEVHLKDKRSTVVSWMNLDKNNAVIWQKITNAVWSVNRQFFQFDLTGCYEPLQLGVYSAEEEGHYDWHMDSLLNTNTVPRKLSMALMLSDPSEFEGGELQVMSGSNNIVSVEQKKGRAWFFPSWMLHRVTPVTKGLRRSAVLWVGGPAFK
jgi:PKHD-type hydroxylase